LTNSRSTGFTRTDFQAAADVIRQKTTHQPTIGLILGSGLGGLADAVEAANAIPYESIPLWPHSTVKGHQGRLVVGYLEKQPVAVLQGRFHFYEGYSLHEVTFPVRVLQTLGVKTLFVTNAAGGLNPAFQAADLMLITDHINLLGMAGNHPLVGPNDESLGPRFPDMTTAYDAELCERARRTASKAGFVLREGVYVGLSGPTFETPAEVRMLRMLGGDAVGMSTVSEVVVARHAGLRVMGVSGITNVANDRPTPAKQTTHEEVLETGNKIVPKLAALIRGVLASMDSA
jgi:purine-nucleoside phosphorylase